MKKPALERLKIFLSIQYHYAAILYFLKIFFHLQLASVLQIGVDQVKNAVSVYCRLGFARKKNAELEPGTLHPSWNSVLNSSPHRSSSVSSVPSDEDPLLAELAAALAELGNPLPSETEGIY